MEDTRIIVFNFDGTIADTKKVVMNTMRATIKELGLPERTDEECEAIIGLPLSAIPETLFPMEDIPARKFADVYSRLFQAYNEESSVKLFPHVMETLEELRGRRIMITIASSRSHSTLSSYIERLGLRDTISYVLGVENVKHPKPASDPVDKTLMIFSLQPSTCIVVGDTVYDIEMGKNAGCRTIGVSYGNGTREALLAAGADYVVDDIHDLMKYV
ncbi:MAG: HAD family hydrolase [Bacteroidaceae bacterium]|nr:HAD family hydrolase [Bacteroidaceae bacterium]